MKGKKLLMTFVVAVLILSFTVTPVRADTPLPQALNNDDQVEPMDISGFTVQPDDYEPPEGMIVIDGGPVPISPYNEIVFKAKPTFYFTRNMAATSYEVSLLSYETGTYEYFKAGLVCTDYFCSIPAPFKLTKANYNSIFSGRYVWTVRAKVGGAWEGWSSSSFFSVFSKKINDDFTEVPTKWQIWNSMWVYNLTKGIIKTDGVADEYSSAYHIEYFTNFDYTVRMKRKVDVLSSNSVLVWGVPSPYHTTGVWEEAIYFNYANYGDWSLWKYHDGVQIPLKYWTLNPAINPFGWNELRVVAVGNILDFYINGVYLGWYDVGVPDGSLVGISMYANVTGTTPLVVDWVKLNIIDIEALAEHDPSMELGLEEGDGVMEREMSDILRH